MSLHELLEPVEGLLGLADDPGAPWPQRAVAFDRAAGLLLDATTLSDDVGYVDRLHYVGDGIISSALLMGKGLEPVSPQLISAYLWLAEANLEQFEFRMRATDLREAESCVSIAEDLQALGHVHDRGLSLRAAVARARLAAYRSETFPQVHKDADVLAGAIRALAETGADNPVALGWRARCLRLQASRCPAPIPLLEDAGRLLHQVLQSPQPQSPVLQWLDAAWGAELVRCQQARYAVTGTHDDLVLACRWASEALTLKSRSVPARCAMARARRATLDTPISVGMEDVDGWHGGLLLVNGRNWHGWLLSREYAAWCRDTGQREGVLQARYVYDIALQVAGTEAVASARGTWLREITSLAPLVTDRLLDAGSPAAAGYRLERGRALFMRERFADEYAELSDVVAAGHVAMAADLREALTATRSDRIGDRGHEVAAIRLLQLTSQVRELPGLEHFRGWLEADDLTQAAGDEPLVYLLPGPTGGWAVGHHPETGWFHQPLPLCLTDPVPTVIRRFHSSVGAPNLPAGARRRAVDSIAVWLWEAVYEPLRGYLAGRTCHVIAHGYLGGLPLHAASPERASRLGALFECDIRYVPSARTLAQSRRTLRDADPHDQVFLGIPPPDGAGIGGATREMDLVARWFPAAGTLRPEDLSPASVLRAARTAGWLHASCHGVADAHDAMRSGLELGGGQRLTLGDLARSATGHLTMAVLSACQTAVADAELPDEELSLAAGMLSTGCGAVVASSWSVPDRATGALMDHFYRHWRGDGLHPAQALRVAQQRLAEADERTGGVSEPAWREPYFWAGLRYLGW